MVVVAPFAAFQIYAYLARCPGRPWCEARLPLAYSFVQSQYWYATSFRTFPWLTYRNVGFLSYWTPAQIPNILLALPILATASHGSYTYFTHPSDPRLTPLYLHHVGMTVLLLLSSHTQIVLRVCSGDAVLWWSVARLVFEDDGRVTRVGRWWIGWVVVWGAVSIVLWAGHYPPA